MRKTKIVCTIGPACDSEETLRAMATVIETARSEAADARAAADKVIRVYEHVLNR